MRHASNLPLPAAPDSRRARGDWQTIRTLLPYLWEYRVRVLFALICLSALGWQVSGVFLTGESPELSPRVKRELPQSALGRMFLTWFAPGPGTGYMFVLCSFAAVGVLSVIFAIAYNAEIRFSGAEGGDPDTPCETRGALRADVLHLESTIVARNSSPHVLSS